MADKTVSITPALVGIGLELVGDVQVGQIRLPASTLYLTVGVMPPGTNTYTPLSMILDTGAFTVLVNGNGLNLPNDGQIQVSGVTGSSPAYVSTIPIVGIQDEETRAMVQLAGNLPVVVDSGFTQAQGLFGMGALWGLGYNLFIHRTSQTVQDSSLPAGFEFLVDEVAFIPVEQCAQPWWASSQQASRAAVAMREWRGHVLAGVWEQVREQPEEIEILGCRVLLPTHVRIG
jgi:hypothetical protein